MRNSEKALGQIIGFINRHARFNTIDEVAPALTEIKRLVDKDTPKKVIEEDNWFSCSNCGFELKSKDGHFENYCSYCGQALEGE
jgi:hypothetical protein